MKRILCSITVLIIIIILGLFKLGIALFEYNGIKEGNFKCVVDKVLEETNYKRAYIIKINNKKFILYTNKKDNIYKIGDLIEFEGKYNKGNGKRNYGGFDYRLYLKTKKIYGIFVSDKSNKIDEKRTISILYKQLLDYTQKYISKVFRSNLKDNNGALLIGMIIGDSSKISKETMERFRDSSITHILAISGANFTYIILMLKFVSKRINYKKLGQFITIICIIFFMNLTGNTASVIRAGVMSILLILSKILHRKYDFFTSLAFSTIIQLIYNPYTIFDLGLLLSYGGVLGIALFDNEFKGRIKNKTIRETISANTVITPIIMYNFNTVSLTFLIPNFFSSILIEPITIIGIICLFFHFKILFIILDILLTVLNYIASICSAIPLSKIYIGTPSLISIFSFYGILSIYLYRKNFSKKVFCKIITILLIILILSNLNYEKINCKINDKLLINFVDVGQGDCTLIRSKNKTIIIDGGGSSDKDYNIGKNIDIPYLLDRRINKIDYLIVSHFDTDHVGGLLDIMEELKVKNAVISKQGEDSENYNMFKKIAKKKKINVLVVQQGDVLNIDDNINLNILWPISSKLINENVLNNNSIVCKLCYKNFSMLFTGDIEEIAEKQILLEYKTNPKVLDSTILKVAHHGSKSSSIQEFLNIIKPNIAIIGVGKNNKFGHPNDGVMDRLNKLR